MSDDDARMAAELRQMEKQFNKTADKYKNVQLRKEVTKSMGSTLVELGKDVCECTVKKGILCGPDSQCSKRGSDVECRLEDHECDNQIVTKSGPRPVKELELFFTEKMGIGVRTAVKIPANRYVIQYVGEIMKHEDYDLLCATTYDPTKFYGLNLLEKSEKFIIDPTVYGNISRFINSSHAPNLITKYLYINNLPVVTLWSNRLITAGEELFFNYRATGIEFICECSVCSPTEAFICTICGRTFQYESDLSKHNKSHSSRQLYECYGCKKSFRTDEYLLKHYRQVHKINVKNVEEAKTKPKCKPCKMLFDFPSLLKRHQEDHHEKKEKKFRCEICDKLFYKEKHLKEHVQVHVRAAEKSKFVQKM